MAELARVLKPGGRLVLSTPRADDPTDAAGQPVPRARVRRRRAASAALASFSSVELFGQRRHRDRAPPHAAPARRARAASPPAGRAPSVAEPLTGTAAMADVELDGHRDRARRDRRRDRARRGLPRVKVAQLVIGGDVAGGQLVALRFARRAALARRRRAVRVAARRAVRRPCPRPRVRGRAPRRRPHVPAGRRAAARTASALASASTCCTRTRSRRRTRWDGSRPRGRRAGDLASAHREPLPPRVAAAAAQPRQHDRTARVEARRGLREHTQRAYERQGYPNRIEVLYNGVDARRALGEREPAPRARISTTRRR